MSLPHPDVATLIAASQSDSEIILLGQLIGVRTLQIVLDTLGGSCGCEIYIPSFENFSRSLLHTHRDAEICRRYNGANTCQLALEYNITTRRIQQIIAAQKSTGEK